MKKAKKVLLILLAIVLLIGCTIGGTIAYLMTATPAVENTFVAGAIGTLTLTEADTDSEAEGEQHNYTIIPGKPITKNPQVTYTPATSNDVGSVYIFVKVTDNDWTYADSKFTQGGLSWTVAEGWTRLGTENVFYLTTSAAVANKSIIANDKIEVETTITKEQIGGITDAATGLTFQAYAIQAEGFDTPADAWAQAQSASPSAN